MFGLIVAAIPPVAIVLGVIALLAILIFIANINIVPRKEVTSEKKSEIINIILNVL